MIAAAVAASPVTAWLMVAAVLPSPRLRDAATVNLGTSAVANTMPGGGAVALGISWAMLSSWGVATGEYVRYALVSGLWNVFVRLGLPIVALSVLVIRRRWRPPCCCSVRPPTCCRSRSARSPTWRGGMCSAGATRSRPPLDLTGAGTAAG